MYKASLSDVNFFDFRSRLCQNENETFELFFIWFVWWFV